MEKPKDWPLAYKFFLDVASEVWQLYVRLKGEQAFSRLKNVKGEIVNGRKQVDPDGVPDGIVFPMLSALSRFMQNASGTWSLEIPRRFPWPIFFEQAMQQETTAAQNNPNTMGKKADCYIALHGGLELFLWGQARASDESAEGQMSLLARMPS